MCTASYIIGYAYTTERKAEPHVEPNDIIRTPVSLKDPIKILGWNYLHLANGNTAAFSII